MGEVVAPDEAGTSVLKHVQVREYVRGLVDGAEPGFPAPSERVLVRRFGVARMTVRQALDTLVAEGLLERVPGRGTFVSAQRPGPQLRLCGYAEEMARRGLRPATRTLLARMECAGPGVARALEIEEGAEIAHWQRLRLADGVPMCLEDAYLAASVVPGLLQPPLPVSLYDELVRRRLALTTGEDSVEADLAGVDEAALLATAPGRPVLRVARRAFTYRRAVVVSRSTYRADRYALRFPLARAADGAAAP